MTKSIEKRTLESTIAGGVLFIISFVQAIVLVPFFLKYWGNEKYSLWITLYAFVNLMRTLDAGHQNYIGNEFNKLFHINKDEAKSLLGSSFKVAYLLGAFELFIYLVILFSGLHKNIVGIDETQFNVSFGILVFLIMWFLVGSVGGILVKIILPLGKYSRSLYLNIIIKVLETTCIIVSLLLGASVNVLCLAISICWLLYTAYIMYDIRKMMPEFYPWWKGGSFKEGLSNLFKSMVITVNVFIEQFSTNGIVIFIANIVGVLKVPVFTTLRTVGNTFIQATTIVLNPLVPELIRFHVKEEYDKIRSIVIANWFVSSLIVNIPLMFLTPYIKVLFEWWTNGKIEFDLALYLTLTMSISLVNYGKTFVVYITGINNLKALTFITSTRFVILLVIGIPLLKIYGLGSIGWSFLAAELVSSVLVPYYFVNKQFKKHYMGFSSKDIMLSLAPSLLLGLYYFEFYFFASLFFLPVLILIFLILLWVQWNTISLEIRNRLLSFLPIR